MKRNQIRRFYLVIFIINVCTITCLSQNDLNLNLFKLTFNDSILKELNIEKLTNLLGRPTATKKNELLADVLGPEIYYHNKGLKFWFSAKNKDTQQRVFSITVYLVRTWDKDYNEFFYPFPGRITPNLNPNQKAGDITQFFKNYPITIQSAEERKKEWNEALKGLKMNLNNTIQYDIIRIRNNDCDINIFCEELTKFLEYLTINYE